MIKLGLIALIGLCQLVDFWFTNRRIRAFGINNERNEVVKSMIRRFGRRRGIALAMAPTGLVVVLLAMWGLNIPLALLAGAKAKLTILQLDSLALEKELRGQRDASSLPLDASLTKADPITL